MESLLKLIFLSSKEFIFLFADKLGCVLGKRALGQTVEDFVLQALSSTLNSGNLLRSLSLSVHRIGDTLLYRGECFVVETGVLDSEPSGVPRERDTLDSWGECDLLGKVPGEGDFWENEESSEWEVFLGILNRTCVSGEEDVGCSSDRLELETEEEEEEYASAEDGSFEVEFSSDFLELETEEEEYASAGDGSFEDGSLFRRASNADGVEFSSDLLELETEEEEEYASAVDGSFEDGSLLSFGPGDFLWSKLAEELLRELVLKVLFSNVTPSICSEEAPSLSCSLFKATATFCKLVW